MPQRFYDAIGENVAFIIMMIICTVFGAGWLIVSATGCDEYEANKRVNFDVCAAMCADAGHATSFEQGLGYVKCECR